MCTQALSYRQWVVMAEKVIDAEYPAFDILRSFAAFSINKSEHTCDDTDQRLERLAHAYGVCKDKLGEQFHRVRPYAVAHCRNTGSSSGEAWCEAISRFMQTNGICVCMFRCQKLNYQCEIQLEE